MHRRPYRHSPWLDVIGLLLVGGVVLGGVAFLVYHAGGAASPKARMSFDTRQTSPRAPSRTAQRSPTAHPPHPPRSRSEPPRSSGSFLSDRRGAQPSGTTAPFSEAWRAEATPSLSAPSGSPDRPSSTHPDASSPTPDQSGPELGSQAGSMPTGANWQAEARRLGHQARALSSQLGQLDDEREQSNQTASSEAPSGPERPPAARRSDQDVPSPPPPSVPIDDHLHWLLVLGVLWGAWRVWQGG